MYERQEDISGRLEGTIIRYGDDPVLVTGHEDFNIFIKFLDGTKREIVSIKDKNLNFKSIPLGYVNYKGGAYYLQRVPERRWKHGISRAGIYSVTKNAPTDYLLGKPLVSTVKNIYCSYDRALIEIEKPSINSIAFNRILAIKKEDLGNKKLNYKGVEVGYFERERVILGKEYTHLKEHLTIKGVKINEN